MVQMSPVSRGQQVNNAIDIYSDYRAAVMRIVPMYEYTLMYSEYFNH